MKSATGATAAVLVLLASFALARAATAQTSGALARRVVISVQASAQPELMIDGVGDTFFTTGIGGTAVAVGAEIQMPLEGRMGVGAEFSVSGLFHDTQRSTLSTSTVEHRDHVLGVVTRLGLVTRERWAVAGSFGPALVIEQTSSIHTFLAPGRPPLTFPPSDDNDMRLGLLGGVTVFRALGSRWALAAPVRVIYVQRHDDNARDRGLGMFIIRGGVGLAVTL
jgi:hypothetical protein